MSPTFRKAALAVAVQAVFAATSVPTASAQALSLQLSALDGSRGFTIDGAAAFDSTGRAVGAAGDVNGDGVDDLIIGAMGASPNGNQSGRSYVVFGSRSGFSSPLALSGLDATAGFSLEGELELDRAGANVSGAGDVNNDGIDDLMIGAIGSDPSGSNSGRTYVVFGRSSGFLLPVVLSNLSGIDGFALNGESSGDGLGNAIGAAGDVNADGVDDIIVGALGADFNGNGSGRSYVIFGRTTDFVSPLPLSNLDGSNGFVLEGEQARDRSGDSVAGAGDINGDGIDDLIIGADGASPNGVRSGRSYVVFGSSSGFDPLMTFSSLDGNNGFSIEGEAWEDHLGVAVGTAGDFNGDGIDDLVVGAPGSPLGNSPIGNNTGRSYVVFGRVTGFSSPIAVSSLDGSDGFAIDGEHPASYSGAKLSTAGDFNGDGLDDLIIAAVGAYPNGYRSGRSYIVFGHQQTQRSTMQLSTLDGANGFAIDGERAEDSLGVSVSAAGDVNADGLDDVVVGAFGADPNGNTSAGRAYVIFGSRNSIFHDGAEAENIDTFFPRLKFRRTGEGGAVKWENGSKCDCDLPAFNFNVALSEGEMAFRWPAVDASSGGVVSGAGYSVLQPGAVIGPGSSFSVDTSTAGTADWRAGVDGFLGFRFTRSGGGVNYGYARITTTAPTGYPVKIVSLHVNVTGQAVTISAD